MKSKKSVSSPRRGRPKGRPNGKNGAAAGKSFGPLGDLIRTQRLTLGLGLQDVAEACRCSVQFVSNIEHGRAPLPWDKAELLSDVLEIDVERIRAANLSIRSDFQSFMDSSADNSGDQLREIIHRFQSAPMKLRKKFFQTAREMLST